MSISTFLTSYSRWLHTGVPAGTIERRPLVNTDGSTNLPGVFIAGDLTGIPLLKFATDSGARIIQNLVQDAAFEKERRQKPADAFDVVILGAGVAGMAAALESRKHSLHFQVLEAASRPFSTIVDFPKGKPIYTYPADMVPRSQLQVTAPVKEALLTELEAQTPPDLPIRYECGVDHLGKKGSLLEVILDGGEKVRALRVVVAIGTSGNYRSLGVPGEEKAHKVFHRLHDPADFLGKEVLVVGGGDSALEAAVALCDAGARVNLSYRKGEFTRAKPENAEALETRAASGALHLRLHSAVERIEENQVILTGQPPLTLPNDVVFTLIGRDAPLEFFRRSGLEVSGTWTPRRVAAFAAFLLFCTFLYSWKGYGSLTEFFHQRHWFPFDIGRGSFPAENLAGILLEGLGKPSFYYTLAYCLVVAIFGMNRIRRRRTPYVTAQTLTLMAVQILPLFLLPEIILPYLGRNGLLPEVILKNLFMSPQGGEEYWRAYGLILAWPLMVYNVFTDAPNAWWLALSFVQTFVLIPGLIYFYGKGVYCGWICSCGALAETLGDTHRHKMPHGPFWNRLNMAGQAILAVCFLLLGLRVWGWVFPGGVVAQSFHLLLSDFQLFGVRLNYKWVIDIGLAGILGVGCYFWYSGRVWCRFFCPLAAWMHIVAKFSSFRILADKKKCISCNVCTSVCHQGIDVMSFANKGLPMSDVECVRCSACVQSCPTGVLSFGRVDKEGRVIGQDRLAAREA